MADKFQLKAIITGVDKLSPTLKGISAKVAGWRKQMERSGLGQIGFADLAQGGAFAAPFVAGVKAAMEFESAMASVRKVVSFDTPQQFKAMGEDIVKMSMRLPMAAKDIAAIVASGGQAGIAREELARFAEDAGKMGIAFDQTAAQSGEMMAKWRTAFRLTQDEVVSLADKVNYLSNNGPASAQQIAGIVTAIGPLGEVAGLASGQIAAMGATLAGVGVKEEVAATGLKNFMLTLTAGTAATKEQQQVFRALRMDSSEVAKSMQQDAQGTMVRVLTAISKVDKARQAAVLTQLFGRESIGAIAPMLTNLELLRKNLGMVGDAAKYAGSMEEEYLAKIDTAENLWQLTKNGALAVSKAIGDALLPDVKEFLRNLSPMIKGAYQFAGGNAEVIKGIAGAALAFAGMRVAVTAATLAMKVFGTAAKLTPIGIAIRVITLAAGALIANWGKVAPFFSEMWESIRAGTVAAWGAVAGFLSTTWESIRAVFSAGFEVFTAFATFSPLGMIIQNWEPIVAWFRDMVGRVGKLLEPITNGAAWIKSKVGGWFDADAPAAPRARESIVQQAAAANRTNLQGAMVVRFENAPQGMRAEPAQTNQPALSITPQVGYRSLAMGGAR